MASNHYPVEIAQAEEASLDLDLLLRRDTHFLSRLASNAAAPTKDPSTIEKKLFTSVKPIVEITYRVLADSSLRATGGLSMAPGPSTSIGSHSLDPSAYIAAFGGIKTEWQRLIRRCWNKNSRCFGLDTARKPPDTTGKNN